MIASVSIFIWLLSFQEGRLWKILALSFSTNFLHNKQLMTSCVFKFICLYDHSFFYLHFIMIHSPHSFSSVKNWFISNMRRIIFFFGYQYNSLGCLFQSTKTGHLQFLSNFSLHVILIVLPSRLLQMFLKLGQKVKGNIVLVKMLIHFN